MKPTASPATPKPPSVAPSNSTAVLRASAWFVITSVASLIRWLVVAPSSDLERLRRRRQLSDWPWFVQLRTFRMMVVQWENFYLFYNLLLSFILLLHFYTSTFLHFHSHSDALKALINNSEGDLRRAITLLQGIHRLKKPLTRAIVDGLSGNLPASLIDSAIQLCSTPGQPSAALTAFINQLIRDAHSPTTFLHQMLTHLLTRNLLSSTATALLVSRLAECEARIGEGADEMVQVLQFMTEMRAVFNPRESVLYRTGSVLV